MLFICQHFDYISHEPYMQIMLLLVLVAYPLLPTDTEESVVLEKHVLYHKETYIL